MTTDRIFTEEAKASSIIKSSVANNRAKQLFYQCIFHITLFKEMSSRLSESKNNLDFENFARSQSCHMNDGIYGSAIHTARMETAKVKTLGYLGTTISSGHKFLRSIKNARNLEQRQEWSEHRKEIIEHENSYRLARNAYQHLDEAIFKGGVVNNSDFSFSVYNVLTFKDSKNVLHRFDFSDACLERLPIIWDSTLNELKKITSYA